MTNLFRIKAFSVVKEGEPEVESDAECDNQTTVGRAWAHHTTVPHTMDPSHTRKVPMHLWDRGSLDHLTKTKLL